MNFGGGEPFLRLMRVLGLAFVAGVAFGCGAGSTRIRLEEDGTLFVGGRPAHLEDLRSLKRPGVRHDLDSVVLDLPPSLTFRRAGDLLTAMIAGAGKINIALRVGSSEATLPLPMDHGCACLSFFDGALRYDEHAKKGWELDHLWLRVGVGPGGAFRVVSIDVGFYEMEVAAPLVPDPPDVREQRRWKGEHPPLGSWSLETLRGFLGDPRIAAQSPFIDLAIGPDDTVGDALACLIALKSASAGRVVVSLRVGP